MNPTQLPFLAEGILILAAMVFGILLHRGGKPFGKVKLVFHVFFFLWFTAGFVFISKGLVVMNPKKVISIPVAVMGLTILIQLLTGILISASQKAEKSLTVIHLTSTVLMFLSDICAFIIAGIVH